MGQLLRGGEIIDLSADLGGGKTTLVKGLVLGLGSTDRVSSPTFTVSKTYKTGRLQLNHFDFYRLDNPGVLAEQLQESLSNPNAVTVVEWSDSVRKILGTTAIRVEIEASAHNQSSRVISISYPESMANIMQTLLNNWDNSKA